MVFPVLSFLVLMLNVQMQMLMWTVPVNLKEQDAFHLTIEEYLLSLIAMAEELVLSLYLNMFTGRTQLTQLIVPSGRQLGDPRRLYATRADWKLHQGLVCRVSVTEFEE